MDKAEEIAREFCDQVHLEPLSKRIAFRRDLAAALRSFRDEGIEEAAKMADECGRGGGYDCPCSEEIRALKSGGKA